MKIAFVNDGWERLGIGYISATLKAAGHKVKLFVDPQLFDDESLTIKWLSRLLDYKKNIVQELKVFDPDIIGISCMSSFYQWACTMARMIKEEMDVPIIFGGIHPTSVPERVIKNDFVDMVCVGEGEYPMLELVNSMEKGQIDYSIKNIWFKRNGSVIQNEVRPLIEDLDSLPFADKNIFYLASSHFAYCYFIMTSRGCPNACSYCCHSYLRKIYKNKGRYVRIRSVENVIQELFNAKNKYKLKYVRFNDDSLGNDIKWLEEFSVKYKRMINLPFICYMHPNDISPESLGYLKDAHCCEIELGMQSWDENIREDIFNRRVSNAQMELAIRLINKTRINLITEELAAYHKQSDEHLLNTAKLYIELKPLRSHIYYLRYFPRVLITQKAFEDGILNTQNYEKVLDGFVGGYFDKDGGMVDKSIVKIVLLFLVIRILPKRIANFIVKRRLYRYFPAFLAPVFIHIINNIPPRSIESAIFQSAFINRYMFFWKKIIFNKINK